MSEISRLCQFLFRGLGDIPIGVFIIQIIVVIVCVVALFTLRAFIFVKNGKDYSHDEAGEVSLPRYVVLDGIFRIQSPDEAAI